MGNFKSGKSVTGFKKFIGINRAGRFYNSLAEVSFRASVLYKSRSISILVSALGFRFVSLPGFLILPLNFLKNCFFKFQIFRHF